MGPTEKAVRDAATPGEALLVLARAIDGQTNSPDVSWALPPAEGEMSHDRAAPAEVSAAVTVMPELPPDWDQMNEDQRGAYFRLIAEGGRPGPEDFLQDQETITVDLNGSVSATFPKPSSEAKAKFAETADSVCENYAPSPDSGASGTPEQVTEWYKTGGPLWLAAFDHGYVMGLPGEMRSVMVQTVNLYAPKEAQLLGRDILRVDTEAAKDFALQDTIDRLAS